MIRIHTRSGRYDIEPHCTVEVMEGDTPSSNASRRIGHEEITAGMLLRGFGRVRRVERFASLTHTQEGEE